MSRTSVQALECQFPCTHTKYMFRTYTYNLLSSTSNAPLCKYVEDMFMQTPCLPPPKSHVYHLPIPWTYFEVPYEQTPLYQLAHNTVHTRLGLIYYQTKEMQPSKCWTKTPFYSLKFSDFVYGDVSDLYVLLGVVVHAHVDPWFGKQFINFINQLWGKCCSLWWWWWWWCSELLSAGVIRGMMAWQLHHLTGHRARTVVWKDGDVTDVWQ